MFKELSELYARLERNEFLLGMASGILMRHICGTENACILLPESVQTEIEGFKACLRNNKVCDEMIKRAKADQ